jgi:hypothetical protein
MNKAYIITFERKRLLDTFNYETFHEQLVNAKGIKSWWHYLDCTYIIIVDYNTTSKNVCDFIQKIIGGKEFFVCELNLNNYNGFLNPVAWRWIEEERVNILGY